VGGISYAIKAEVGLLSRNIRIIGADYNDMFSESFGARVIVGTQMELGDDGDPIRHVGKYYNELFYKSGRTKKFAYVIE